MRNYAIKAVSAIVSAAALISSCNTSSPAEDVCSYVDALVGTAYNGHTFPGACVPFGMIQASPETGRDIWKYCSGYSIDDDALIGFAQNHLNGTGCPDLGDILILPFIGDQVVSEVGYDKTAQRVSPGYYGVNLDNGVKVDVTATDHTSQYLFEYPAGTDRKLSIDYQSGLVFTNAALHTHVLSSDVKIVDAQTITGHQNTKNWVNRDWFFAISLSEPVISCDTLARQEGENSDKIVLNFGEGKKPVQVKISMSSVSIDGALASLAKENPDWDFDVTCRSAHERWNSLLSRVEVKGSVEQKKNVYTSLYHLYIQPNNIADHDGSYRGADNNVYKSSNGAYFSTFSLWDTYRAAHPFYTILNPEMVDGFVQSMVSHAGAQGYLPIWTLWGKENHCMIANHSVPVIVEAFMKGFKGFDPEKAFDAIKKSLTENHPKSDWVTYDRYGYYPYDIITVESVSRTLESCYDDYCAAVMAKALGREDDYEFFSKRSQNYKNLFDHSTNLMRPKDSKGDWKEPFDQFVLSHASTSGGDYTEGNAWQYTWHVQQAPEDLISLMGGPEAFASKLDSLFFLETTSESTGFVSDVTGLIGQYAHGNEPSHHVVYFYELAGKPWKTEALVREVFDKFYSPEPDGLCGNDDCGQMSAWYLFSAMGFYPVDPVSMNYVIGAPQIPEMTLHLPGGKTFTSKAQNLSEANRYVKSVTLNGKPLSSCMISHQDIIAGGVLEFEMTSEPVIR